MRILFLLFLLSVIPTAACAQGLQFYPLTPCRLVDTRSGSPVSAGGSLSVAARGVCGVPVGAQAVVGNVTSVLPSGGGWLTVYSSDVPVPPTASSNYTAGSVINNVFTSAIGADGAFKVFTVAATHLVADVTGYYAPPGAGGLYFHPLPSPVRLFDTRPQPACITPGAALAAGSTTTIQGSTTCSGVTIPVGAQALVGNATTVNPGGAGWLTLFPADAALPLASSGNYTTGQTLNSQFYVGLSPGGQFKLFTVAATHIVVDISGYFSPDAMDINGAGLLFYPITPTRLLDTRAGFTACFAPGAALAGGVETPQSAAGSCGIPVAAKAVIGNATVVAPSAGGWLTLWPSDVARPNTAASNFLAGQAFNRHFTVGLGADGAFKVYPTSTTHLVIDVGGYFAP